MIIAIEGVSGRAQRSAEGMHCALNTLSRALVFQPELGDVQGSYVLFCQAKSTATTLHDGIIISEPDYSYGKLLEKVGMKYLETNEVFQLLLHLHLAPSVRCIVLDGLEDLVSPGVLRKATLALALSCPQIETVIVTADCSVAKLCPSFAHCVQFKE